MTPRERARFVLRSLGLGGLHPERVAGGQNNEVWLAGSYVLRISGRPEQGRLAREAAVLPLVPPAVPHPTVVACGEVPGMFWQVTERLPGVPLVQAWPELSEAQRRGAVHQLGAMLRELHGVPAGPPAAEPAPVMELLAEAVRAGAPRCRTVCRN